jgi:hypothetical protein
MAANPKSPLGQGPVLERYHVYHAEAQILSGELEHPIKEPLEKYGHVALEHTRRESLSTRSVGQTNIEGLISFKSGHTRVVGTQVKQKTDILGNDHAGWVTLSTATIEGYNVVDTVTADRVVAQVSTEHPMTQGHVPKVSFLGTRFENLQIGGYKVQVELDLGLCGTKPESDRSYLEDGDFLDRIERQFESVRDTKGLPDVLKKKYKAEIDYIDDLRRRAKKGAKGNGNGYPKLQCSLVKSIGEIPIPGVKTFGNVIFIPNFGTVALATLEVGIRGGESEFQRGPGNAPLPASNSNYFTLNMFDMNLGCPVGGKAKGPGVSGNGQTSP